MELKLVEAYHGVYKSSKEILKDHQRHLYNNMLDLLGSTCKTLAIFGHKTQSDEFYNFWLMDILPLVFDSDQVLQVKAMEAFEQGLTSLDLEAMHGKKQWYTKWKNKIVTCYTGEVNKLRENHNKYWSRLWCILIQILDREIFIGAACINAFLYIVELGFRNTNSIIRIESLQCWRFLIEVFYKHNELTKPKRIKLLSIPLKSSQAKCAEGADMKFRVWWYLITQLYNADVNTLRQHFSSIVEPFLLFCYGASIKTATSTSKCSLCAAEKYVEVRQLALPCLTIMLSKQRDNQLEQCLVNFNLESLNSHESIPLMNTNLLEKHWSPLAKSALKALNLNIDLTGNTTDIETRNGKRTLLDREAGNEHDDIICHQLMKNLMHLTLHTDIGGDLVLYMCSKLSEMIVGDNEQKKNLAEYALNILADEGVTLKKCLQYHAKYAKIIKTFVGIITQSFNTIAKDLLKMCVKQLLRQIDLKENWTNFVVLSEQIFFSIQEQQQDNYVTFGSKLLLWSQFTDMLIRHFEDNLLHMQMKTKIDIVECWLIWPLQLCCGFARPKNQHNDKNIYFNEEFCFIWCRLFQMGEDTPSREKFLLQIHKHLEELLHDRLELNYAFGELFDAYAHAIAQLKNTHIDVNNIGIKSKNKYHYIYSIIIRMLKMCVTTSSNGKMRAPPPKETIERCLDILRSKIIIYFTNSDITETMDDLKAVVTLMMKMTSTETSLFLLDEEFFIIWKKAVLQKLYIHPNKDVLDKIFDLFKINNSDTQDEEEHVVTPSERNLNPDKLTEHQKESMKQNQIMPALYNDMSTSQSQDSFLKPWTPKKIVIPNQQDATTIFMVNSDTNNPITLITDSTEAIEKRTEETIEVEKNNLNNKENETEINKSNAEVKRNSTDNIDKMNKTNKGGTNNTNNMKGISKTTKLPFKARRPCTRQTTKIIKDNSRAKLIKTNSRTEKLTSITKGRKTRKSVSCWKDNVQNENEFGLEKTTGEFDCSLEGVNNFNVLELEQLHQQQQQTQQSDVIATIAATTSLSPILTYSVVDTNLMTPTSTNVKQITEKDKEKRKSNESTSSPPSSSVPIPISATIKTENVNDQISNVSSTECTDSLSLTESGLSLFLADMLCDIKEETDKGETVELSINSDRHEDNNRNSLNQNATAIPLTEKSLHNISPSKVQITEGVRTITPITTNTQNNKDTKQEKGIIMNRSCDETSGQFLSVSPEEIVSIGTTITVITTTTITTASEFRDEVQQKNELSPQKNLISNKESNCDNGNGKDASPKRTTPTAITTTRFAYSPSGRKLISNNSTSPTVKSKCIMATKAATTTASHLTGRGAKLINMIRNRKSETIATTATTTVMTALTPTITPATIAGAMTINNKENDIMMMPAGVTSAPIQKQQLSQRHYQSVIPATPSSPTPSSTQPSATTITTTAAITTASSSATIMDNNIPTVNDLLEFCKRLPSPTASPTVGILKRKFGHDSSSEDFATTAGTTDTPVAKRKKVSFHDPVSITKEYIVDRDERRSKIKKCLSPDNPNKSTSSSLINFSTPSSTSASASLSSSLSLLLRSRNTDSGANVNASAANGTATSTAIDPLKLINSPLYNMKDNEQQTLQQQQIINNHVNVKRVMATIDNDNDDNNEKDDNNDNDNDDNNNNDNTGVDDEQQEQLTNIASTTSNEKMNIVQALAIVLEKCSLTQLLEEYFAHQSHMKLCQDITSFLITAMQLHPEIKKIILESLSENLSNDFVYHAIQKNSAISICDHLPLDTVLTYACTKAKSNADCRNILFEHVADIMKNCKNTKGSMDIIKSVLDGCTQLGDGTILELIDILMGIRQKSKNNNNNNNNECVNNVNFHNNLFNNDDNQNENENDSNETVSDNGDDDNIGNISTDIPGSSSNW